MHDNLGEEQKKHLKTQDINKNKKKHDNHNIAKKKKNSWGDTRKKKRKLCVMTLIMNKRTFKNGTTAEKKKT